MNKIGEAIDRGLKFLNKEQRRDGSFWCLVSTKIDDYRKSEKVPAIVPTNFVLSSLIHLPESDLAEKIKRRAADFLLKEKSAYWSFNYWFRKSDWYKKEPYPDDTDDTFCPLAALYEYKPALFDGEVMAKIVTMLTSTEKEEGGPYDMWLVPPQARDKWNDMDLVCNSNIAYFLSLQNIHLPKVVDFLEQKIDAEGYEFPYNKIYPGIYFIARFYKGKKTEKMITLLLKKQEQDGKWENPLRTALAISALINFSGDRFKAQLEKGVKYLLKTQSKLGAWKPYSFYFQMRTKEKTLYAGSSTITTALALEALNKFQQIESKSKNENQVLDRKAGEKESEQRIYNEVVKRVKKRFLTAGDDLKKDAHKIIAKIRNENREQIVLLAYFFKQALGEVADKISEETVIRLGAANFFGWIAYTIYDDFLDEEGDPGMLSVANVALREAAELFGSALSEISGFDIFSKKIFDLIDNANSWEVNNCRMNEARTVERRTENVVEIRERGIAKFVMPDFGDYSQLADKSLGHALGPLGILFALGFRENSSEVKKTMLFFKHYLIARQLNDDAHDWEEDLRKGQVNAVVAQVFKDAKGDAARVSNELFWKKSIVPVCRRILWHTGKAKKILKEMPLITDRHVFEDLISKIESSAQKAFEERDETLRFLKTYISH